MKKGKSIRIFLIAIVALAIVAVTAICVFGTDGTVTRGDMNGDGRVDSDDAVYLLRHTFLPSRYPVGQSADVNGDGKINSDDAVYLCVIHSCPEDIPSPVTIKKSQMRLNPQRARKQDLQKASIAPYAARCLSSKR